MTHKIDKKLLLRAFPKSLANKIESATDLHNIFYWDKGYKFKIGDETIIIPYRAYLELLPTVNDRLIRMCVSSRSTNGYMRQVAIEDLIRYKDLPNWALPYLFVSLGDYATPVSLLLPKLLTNDHKYEQSLRELVQNHPEITELIRQKAISYWNEYHRRRWHTYKNYPPVVLIDRLKQ